jgi:hypothetical protein
VHVFERLIVSRSDHRFLPGRTLGAHGHFADGSIAHRQVF